MDLSIIVVSYNTRDITLECLRSVYAETCDCEFELLVVDNNSSDGTAEAIRREFPDVWLDALDTNLGFAGANNHAAKQAKGRYILLLNPDTLVLDGAIQTLVRFAESYPGRGVFGGRTLFPDHSLNPSSCWSRITLWSSFCSTTGLTAAFRGSEIFNPEAFGAWERDSVREVDIIAGCFLLLERSFWEELEGFDTHFQMYGEDADLCLRAGRLGAHCVMTPSATIVHYGGASEPVRADAGSPLQGTRPANAAVYGPCGLSARRRNATSGHWASLCRTSPPQCLGGRGATRERCHLGRCLAEAM